MLTEESSKFKVKDEIAELQERIVTIRQWLKDQYILYRDYSSLAQTVNSKYIPSSLEDAKKVYVLFIQSFFHVQIKIQFAFA